MNYGTSEYSQAIFSLAKESGQLDEYVRAIKDIDGLFSREREYVDFLCAPSIPKKERTDAASKVLEGYPREVVNFVLVMTEKGRMRDFHACALEIEDMYLFERGISRAVVKSATELSEAQQQALRAAIEKRCGHEVVMSVTVDPHLIGGITCEVDGKVIDGSIRSRLNHIKEVIAK